MFGRGRRFAADHNYVRPGQMEVAGEVVQDLAAYLQLTELQSIASFPDEMSVSELALHQ